MTTSSNAARRAVSIAAWAVVAAIGLAACDKAEPPPPSDAPVVADNTVRFPAGSAAATRIVTFAAKPSEEYRVTFPARLAWDEDHTARITAPLAGRIVQILAKPGDTVKQNQPLAYLASPDLGSAQAEAARARIDVAQAQKTLARTTDLAEAGIIAAKDREQAQTDLARAEAEAARSTARLRSLGAGSDVDQRFAIRSPIAGVVVERALNPGMESRPDQGGAPLFVVSDPTYLWCMIDAPEAAARDFAIGSKVMVRANAFPGETFEATVDHVADALDPVTRTLKVRSHLRNPQRKLKAEMFVSAEIRRNPGGTLDVPAGAVFLSNGAQHVFVQTAQGTFTRRRVDAVPTGDGKLSVTQGLQAGEPVVADGALYLQQLLDSKKNLNRS